MSEKIISPERLAEIERNHLHCVDGEVKLCPGKFGSERCDVCDLLAALREATEAVMALEHPIQAALINERDALLRRVEALEKALVDRGFHKPVPHYWYQGRLVEAPKGIPGENCDKCEAALCGRGDGR